MRRSRASVSAPTVACCVWRHQTLPCFSSKGEQKMYVMIVSTISDKDKFWGSLKKAYSHLPSGASWAMAVGSTDGTRAVNIIVHDSIDSVKSFFEEYAGPF